ncbi:hypothetical protein MRX96_013516 [Rhipicephalus microplus]
MFPFPQNFQEDPACRLADLAVANRLLSLTWFVTSKWREKQAAPLRVTLWKYTTARLPSNLGSAHGFLVYGGTCRAGVIFYFLLPSGGRSSEMRILCVSCDGSHRAVELAREACMWPPRSVPGARGDAPVGRASRQRQTDFDRERFATSNAISFVLY